MSDKRTFLAKTCPLFSGQEVLPFICVMSCNLWVFCFLDKTRILYHIFVVQLLEHVMMTFLLHEADEFPVKLKNPSASIRLVSKLVSLTREAV